MNSLPVAPVVWFKRWGWLYRPVSLAGVVLSLAALAFCANVFLAIDRHSPSASDTLYGVYPYFAATFLLWVWVAGHTAEN